MLRLSRYLFLMSRMQGHISARLPECRGHRFAGSSTEYQGIIIIPRIITP